MNYNDQILENKAFNIFKQFMFYIVLAIVIVMGGCLVMVYAFKYKPYQVLSNSMSPVYYKNDMVVTKAQNKYYIGDILKFTKSTMPTTHRIIDIKQNGNTTIYICFGDASTIPAFQLEGLDVAQSYDNWKTFVQTTDLSILESGYGGALQFVESQYAEGKVVAVFKRWGGYYEFINNHKILLIGMVVGIWCVIETIQGEMEIKRGRRFAIGG